MHGTKAFQRVQAIEKNRAAISIHDMSEMMCLPLWQRSRCVQTGRSKVWDKVRETQVGEALNRPICHPNGASTSFL